MRTEGKSTNSKWVNIFSRVNLRLIHSHIAIFTDWQEMFIFKEKYVIEQKKGLLCFMTFDLER